MREFIEHDLGVPVRYIINTHHHADHTWGNCFFPGTTILAHERCRTKLEAFGMPSLERPQAEHLLRQVKIVLPHITFLSGEVTLRVGRRT